MLQDDAILSCLRVSRDFFAPDDDVIDRGEGTNNSKMMESADDGITDSPIALKDVFRDGWMVFRNYDAIGEFGIMKDGTAARYSPDDVNSFLFAGIQIDFGGETLEVSN